MINRQPDTKASLADRLRRRLPLRTDLLAPVLAIVVAVAAVGPALLAPGLLATRAAGDSPFLLQRTFEMAAALSSGHLPPRWMPDAAYGLGYPFWNFYGPLAYLATGLWSLMGAGTVGAIKAAWLVAFVVAALGAYRLGRQIWGRPAAGLAVSAAYTLAPYHLVNVYVRGDALSEVLAYGLVPWVLVAIAGLSPHHDQAAANLAPSTRDGSPYGSPYSSLGAFAAAEGRRRRMVLGLSASLALLLVSHNISALLAAPLIAAFALWAWLESARHDPDRVERPARSMPARPRIDGSSQAPGWLSSGALPSAPSPFAATPPPAPPGAGLKPVAWAAPVRLVARWLGRSEAALWRRRVPATWSGLAALVSGGLLGLGLAAWFWFPALAEGPYVQLSENLSGYFDYAGHWLSVNRLVSLAVPFGYAAGENCSPCRAGIVQIAAAMLGLAWVARQQRAGLAMNRPAASRLSLTSVPSTPLMDARRTLVFWTAVAVIATLLMTALSAPLWKAVPLLAYAQFPWRWLSIQALALAVLTGGIAVPAQRNTGGELGMDPGFGSGVGTGGGSRSRGEPESLWFGRLAALLVSLALAAVMLPRLPVDVLSVAEVKRDDLVTFELFSGNIGSTVRAEYLPVGVAPRPWSGNAAVWGQPGLARAVDGTGDVNGATLLRRGAAWQEWQVRLRTAATVAFPTYWFPGWEVQIGEGDWRPAGRVDGSGWIKASIEPEDCSADGICAVQLRLGRSLARAGAEGVSILAALVWLALWLSDRRRRMGRSLVLLVLAVLLPVGVARALPTARIGGPVTLDLTQRPYPHANPGGLRLGGAKLASASLRTPFGDLSEPSSVTPEDQDSSAAMIPHSATAAQVTAGQPVTVNLNWQDLADGTRVEAALVSPAAITYGVPDVLATDERRAPDVGSFQLAVPQEAPPGLYFVRLSILDDGPEPARTFLGPVRITSSGFSGPTDAIAIMGDAWLLKLDATLEPVATDPRVVVDMTWRAVRPLAVDYQTSVRLLDSKGKTLSRNGVDAQEDKQPGYGYLPTTTWPAGEAIRDRRWVNLPAGIRPDQVADVEVVLYDLESKKEIGRSKTRLTR